MWIPVLLFSKLNQLFFGYFDPVNMFLIMKINKVRGDLTDISVEIEALVDTSDGPVAIKAAGL